MNTNTLLTNESLWIGLALVEQPVRDGVLGDADRAYVNVLTLANSERNFRKQLIEALNGLGLRLIELEDTETMESRLAKHSVHPDLRKLAEEVKHTGSLRFDTFQTFDYESKDER